MARPRAGAQLMPSAAGAPRRRGASGARAASCLALGAGLERWSADGGTARRRVAHAPDRRCAQAARRIRRSSGVVTRAGGWAGVELGRRTWPRILIWVFACAALVVRTMMRAETVRQREA